MLSPLVGMSMNTAVYFFAYGVAKDLLADKDAAPGTPLSLWRTFVAGGIGGAVLTIIESPTDLVKSKLQIQRGAKGDLTNYTGTVDAFKKSALA